MSDKKNETKPAAATTPATSTKAPTPKTEVKGKKSTLFLFDREGDALLRLSRELAWGVIHSLDRIKDEGARFRRLIRISEFLGNDVAVARGMGFYLDTLIQADPKLQALRDIAASLTDRGRKFEVKALDFHNGSPEAPRDAAKRLMRTAILHPNPVTAGNWRTVREAVVKAGLIEQKRAEELSVEYRKVRDEKKAAKTAEKKKAETPKEEKKAPAEAPKK